MDAIEKRARELLAAEYEARGELVHAMNIGRGGLSVMYAAEIAAIAKALTPHQGYVLVPEAMTDDMEVAFAEARFSKVRAIDDCEPQDAWAAALAVRPEVK